MEETAERPSRMKDMSASLKRLRQSSRSKISQLFHRNKTASDTSVNVSSSNNLPDLNDSITAPNCTQCHQGKPFFFVAMTVFIKNLFCA